MAVRHVFLWRVGQGNDPDQIVELLNTLPSRCPGILHWEIGHNQAPPNENGAPWDGALISAHESWEALDAYSQHPYHAEVVGKVVPLMSDRAVVDFELS
jgi:Stress responsive A/B Barrel Domain